MLPPGRRASSGEPPRFHEDIMQFFISLFLLGLVLLLPLYAGASVLRWVLDSFGRLFDKSLVQHRDSVQIGRAHV